MLKDFSMDHSLVHGSKCNQYVVKRSGLCTTAVKTGICNMIVYSAPHFLKFHPLTPLTCSFKKHNPIG